MHNDCYMVDKFALCELYKSLEKNTNYEFAAPQLFEQSDSQVVVPHAHHKNLHIMKTSYTHEITYDIDFEMVTKRLENDFIEGPQIDFMEDHAYLGKSSSFHLYIDEEASHTMEYIDNVLKLRSKNTSAWFVPTSRFVFNVDKSNLDWKDIAYFSYKRSENVGLKTVDYLTKKWKVKFPVTGIWNYVKYTMLDNYKIYENIPDSWLEQRGLFLSWFESIGFNTYNNKHLNEAIYDYENEYFTIRKNTHINFVTNIPDQPRAEDIIETIVYKQKFADVTLNTGYIPISFYKFETCDHTKCGMMIVDDDVCTCYVYNSPFDLTK